MALQTITIVPIRPLVLHRLNKLGDDGGDISIPLVLEDPQATSETQAPVMVPVASRQLVRIFTSFPSFTDFCLIVPIGYDSDGAGGYTLVGPLGEEATVGPNAAAHTVTSGKFAAEPVDFNCAGVGFVQVRIHLNFGGGTGTDVHLKFV